MNALSSIVAAPDDRPGDPTLPDVSIHVGLVRLCGRDLAVPAEFVREVVHLPNGVQPAFARADALAGSIVVRGQVIPVVNVAHLLGFGQDEPGPGAVVVLRREQDLVGLFVHAVSGLTSVRASEIQPYVFNRADAKHVVASSFALDDRLFGVVDTAAIMDLPGIPRAREVPHIRRGDTLSGQRRVLVLSVAGAELAIEATTVVATVPATQVRAGPEVSDQWAGVIDYLDLEVPVIDDIGLLGLSGRAADGPGALVILVRLGDDQLLGIKADRVHRIMAVREQDIRALPLAIAGQLPMFTGSVNDGNGGQSLLVSSAAMASDAALRTIAALTQRKRKAGKSDSSRSGAGDAPSRSAVPRPYLVFRAGTRRRACALSDITQIVPLPKDHGRLASAGSPLCGFISHAGAPVALIDLSTGYTGAGADEAEERVVLIVTAPECATGFIVDQLDTIAQAVAHTLPQRTPDAGTTEAHFIQARVAGKDEAVRVCRLDEEVQRLSARLWETEASACQ